MKLEQSGAYQKRASSKATIGEASGIARSAVVPAVIAARWAIAFSVLACVIAGVALAVVVSR